MRIIMFFFYFCKPTETPTNSSRTTPRVCVDENFECPRFSRFLFILFHEMDFYNGVKNIKF